MSVSIYEKYGGFDFFHKCIYGLYLDMFDHPEISYHFIGVDIERLSLHQTQFLVRAIGGPDNYQGRPLWDVHKSKEISDFQFQEIAKAFRQVFIDHGVSSEDADFIMNFVASHKKEVVTKKKTAIDRFMIPIYQFFDRFGKWVKNFV